MVRLVIYIRRQLQRLLGVATVGVKALIIDAGNRVLLVEHTYVQGWHLPGGGLASGESPKVAMCREVQEETGLEVLGEPQLFGAYAHKVYGADDYPLLYVVRQFKIQEKQPCQEIKQIAWFAWQDLPPTVTDSTRQRIKEVFEGLSPADIW
ncbi:NUDIX domain-containing protein [Candidatus Berkiella aquae]|nr:NUDIX domain-containing protein [Candidatus Berkiella aquae]MCS5712418.1 NUDIX domain-containing protein [Candidatus Berkiella aquae]